MAKRRTRKPQTIKQKLAVLEGISNAGGDSRDLIQDYQRLERLGGNYFTSIAKEVASDSFPVSLTCLVMRRGFRGAMEEIEQRIDTLLQSMRRKRF